MVEKKWRKKSSDKVTRNWGGERSENQSERMREKERERTW